MKKFMLIFVFAILMCINLNASWQEIEEIHASDGAEGDYFGYSVCLSGDYAIIGAYSADSPTDDEGAAYMYHYSGGTWAEQQIITASDGGINDNFGRYVAISGDYAVVGANYADNPTNNEGAAYVFHRVGDTWTEQQKLSASDAAASDYFGRPVSISGDYIIVGAYGNDDAGSSTGSAYIFHRDGVTWTQQAKLTANDMASGDYFGTEVAISGDYAIVGAYGDDNVGSNSGSAYIFHRDGVSWIQQDKITATNEVSGASFGRSVDIRGDYAIVGAWGTDEAGNNSGSAYIFHRSGVEWTQQEKLTASDAAEGDFFGWSVSISGDIALVGSEYADVPTDNEGAAYIFARSGESWTQQQKLSASDATVDDYFSQCSYISGDRILIGAHGEDTNGNSSGSAYFFEFTNIAPSFTSTPSTDATAYVEYTYNITTTDDGENSGGIVITAPTCPDWLNFTDNGDGTASLTGTPDEGDAGSNQVSLTVSDGYASANQPFTITVAADPGTGTASGTPADNDPLPIPVVPLEPHDYDGNGAVVVDPDVEIDPSTPGATITVDVVVTTGNGDVIVPVNASLTYEVTLTGTDQPVVVVLHFDGLPFTPDELVWNNGLTWETVPGVMWNIIHQTATFTWTFDTPLRDGGEYFVMNNGEGSTLPVQLSAFSATFTAEESVLISWTTQSEQDLLGYRILKSETEVLNDAMMINTNLILALNGSNEHTYNFSDPEIEEEATYNYWLEAIEMNGSSSMFGPTSVTINGEEEEDPPAVYTTMLQQNTPNPFNPTTTIRYSIADDSHVAIKIYNLKGQLVRTLVDEEKTADEYTIEWHGNDDHGKACSSGVYFYRMETINRTEMKKMILLK